jgi:NitT/TauT family transport system substrate-binding protein
VLLDAPGDEAYSSVLIRTADAEKYTSAADIAGGSFGIPSVNSQPWLDVRTLVEEAGGDPDSIQFTEVPNPLQALRQGQVDFVTAPQPTVSAGVLEGDVTILTPLVLEDMGGIIGYPYLTTSDLVESDPALVQSFRRALIKANTLINSDRELALEVAATYLDVPEEVLQASTLPVLGEEMPTVEDMQKHIDRIVAAGIIAADDAPKAADLLAKQ